MKRHLRSAAVAKPKQPQLFRWLLFLPLPAVWWLAGTLGWLNFLENKFLDWRFQFRGELDAPVKVVYVDIDSKSITDIGNQPWDRAYFARLGQALLQAGRVKAIGIDYVFSQKGKPQLVDEGRFASGNRELSQFLFSGAPVVAAASYASSVDRDINGTPLVREFPRVGSPLEKAQPPEIPEFRDGPMVKTPPLVGLIDTIDGGTRAVHFFAHTAGKTYFHMAAELARLYWGLPPGALKVHRDRVDFIGRGDVLLASVPLQEGQNVEVNWFSAWQSPERNLRTSFSDAFGYAELLTSTNEVERGAAREFFAQFEGAVVLIGPVDPLLQDIAPTPFDEQPVPRVGIHGNLLKTIVSGIYLQRLSPALDALLIFGLALSACGLAIRGGRRGPLWKALALVLVAGYVAGAFLIFARAHHVLPLTAPVGAAFTTSFAGLLWQLLVEEKQKSRIKGMFGTYVSPELVSRMIESHEEPKLGGEEAQITAYFSDIENFSTFSERLSPPQVVELMNEYLTACTDIVTAQGGTLDKYIGDAVVAMFGAPIAMPDHAHRACVASQRVQLRLAELREKWLSEGSRWPAIVGRMHTRIGLNSGAAVVGNMGSLTRFNYTMMGDTVNLAARLEGAAKSYGAGTLVTEATKNACELGGDECVFRFLDRIVVKGRSKPVMIFEIVGLKQSIPPKVRECVGLFGEAMEKYLKQDWTTAAALFQKAAVLESHQITLEGETNPSVVYAQRCEVMKLHPPSKDWDGVFVMKTK
jgi:adenylate cyclase